MNEDAPLLTYDFDADVWTEDAFVMVRRGEGERPAPEEEPRPGLWFVSEKGPPERHPFEISERVRDGATVALFALLVVGFVSVWNLGVPEFGALLAALALLMVLAFAGRSKRPRATAYDVGLLEHPEDPDVCLVEIRIVRDGKPVGSDRGAVWFEGGRLLFSGHRTSFAVGGEDVLPFTQRAKGLPLGALPLRVRQGQTHIEFRTLQYGDADLRRYDRFAHRLLAFRSFAPPARGERQWPPFEE